MANQLIITGKYLGAKPTKTVGQNNTLIREFYIDMTDNIVYPNTPEFQLRGNSVNLVDNLQVGQMIQVTFAIEGRKYTNQQTSRESVITNLRAWKIELVQMQSAAVAAAPASRQTNRPAMTNQFVDESDNNDLPF